VHCIYTGAEIIPIELNSTVLLPTSTRESLVHVCLRTLLQEPTINNIVIGGIRERELDFDDGPGIAKFRSERAGSQVEV
jgi:hypothetical protein